MTEILNNLSALRIDVRFFSDSPIQMKYWIGAVMRNRFLFAAESVSTAEGVSLRSVLDTLPLPESHFLYKHFGGGFPKGFFIDCSRLPGSGTGFKLAAARVYSFSVVLIGSVIAYRELFEEAIRKFLDLGFGEPPVPLTLVDVNHTELSLGADSDICRPLSLELNFKTPVCLVPKSSASSNGFQGKMNGFPSVYQLARSAAYRLATLAMLYDDPSYFFDKYAMADRIETFVVPAAEAVLISADIRYAKCYSTPKKGHNTVYLMGGYVGSLRFDNVPAALLPLLSAGSVLGVGSDINYGLGCYDLRVIER